MSKLEVKSNVFDWEIFVQSFQVLTFKLRDTEKQKKKKIEVLREEKEGCEYLGLGTVLALVKIQPTELLKKLKTQVSMKGIKGI